MAEPSRISNRQKFGYGTGHVLNDLCASMWFTYLLIYFHDVQKFSQVTAGYILLTGQIADGISTTFVGYESDRYNCFCRYSKRKSWHLLGTICVIASFPLIFVDCIGCTANSSELSMFVYYAPLVVIFQFGWASTQISHLSLIPDLSFRDDDQVFLNSLRYGMTVASNILVYLLAWMYLNTQSSESAYISPADAPAFRNLVVTAVGIGSLFSLVFHLVLKETPPDVLNVQVHSTEKTDDNDDDGGGGGSPINNTIGMCPRSQMVWSEWFKNPLFYLNGLTYMSTRLVVNISQVYLPLYLQYTLNLDRTFIAIIPLIAFLGGLVGAVGVRVLSKWIRQEAFYVIGCALVIGACIWAKLLDGENSQFYGMAVLLGMGSSVLSISALSMTSKLIGDNKATTAFVYGVMSLSDKLSNGIGVMIIQKLNPCACECPLCGIFYQNIMSYVICGMAIVGLASVLFTVLVQRGIRSRRAGYEAIE